ncbi:TetR/AcrR family transcriptional regulator [Novosphingobium sp. NBM11]|uniref:TetR/AcrR family transcriptional regulator n=2 Tax=Sphingomonadaceae TaxID=41297 RepID=UPI0018927AE8|nr:TetR/AcrR family transcriptional regulator [Novosphingobium sp. NBM11]MBF5089183.1 TetR/AcrR family transcriptional regulator [Novosphingobium sp. NBM11]
MAVYMAKQQAHANADQSERLSKHDWIVAALQEVGNGGVAQVRIEVLARALGVTKGSFYWHFKDRDALLGEMLRFWQQSLTSAVGRFVRTKIETPRDRLSYLLGLASEDRSDVPGGTIEHALREWARSSELARHAISDVDSERLTIIAEIYRDMGMSKSRAAAAALLALSHLIGVNVIHRDVGLQAFRAQREVCLEFLLELPERMQ